jgi:hypothetical protein
VVNAAIALCVGIIAGTALYTGLRYRELPDQVPLHFGITGYVDGTGPRPAIWLIVAFQIFIGLTYGLATFSGSPARMLWVGCWVVAFCAWLQVLIVSVAINGTNRLPVAVFWLVVVLFIAGVFGILALGS